MADITLAAVVAAGAAFYAKFTLALLRDLKSDWTGYFLRLDSAPLEYLELLPADPDSSIDIAA